MAASERESIGEFQRALDELGELIGMDPYAARARARELRAEAVTLAEPRRQVVSATLTIREAEAAQRIGDIALADQLVRSVRDDPASRDRALPPDLDVLAGLVLSRIHGDLADFPTALEHALDAAAVIQRADLEGVRIDTDLHVRVLVKMGDLMYRLGDLSEARSAYELAETQAEGDARLHLLVVNNRAFAEAFEGNPGRARELVDRMQALSARYGRPLNANELDTVAQVLILDGDSSGAVRVAQAAVESLSDHDTKTFDDLPDSLLTLAMALRSSGRLVEAGVVLSQAWTACGDAELSSLRARLLEEEAELNASRGDFRAAFDAYKRFHGADRKLLSAQREARALARQAVYGATQARADADRARYQARHDPLTGLRNRRAVEQDLPPLLAAVGKDPGSLGVAILDVDHFKSVNDTFSHDVGDAVLVRVAGALAGEAARHPMALTARLGGEEFLLVAGATDESSVLEVVERARHAVASQDWSDLTPGRVITLSAGLTFAAPGQEQPAILKSADRQLYAAKRGGRDRTCIAEPGDEACISDRT